MQTKKHELTEIISVGLDRQLRIAPLGSQISQKGFDHRHVVKKNDCPD